jgi:hypothetical protein
MPTKTEQVAWNKSSLLVKIPFQNTDIAAIYRDN